MADGLTDPGLLVWTGNQNFKSGSEELDALIRAQMDKLQRFPAQARCCSPRLGGGVSRVFQSRHGERRVEEGESGRQPL